MTERKLEIVTLTNWIDDGNGGVIPVEAKYTVKDKGDSMILTPVENKIEKEEVDS